MNLTALCAAAASLGFVHTLLGPDHYLPFLAMSRVGGWSLRKTVGVTLLCGVGHVLSSAVLGVVGIALGVGVFKLNAVEGYRAELAGWLLLAFGAVYFVIGLRRAVRRRPHTHWHAHADGSVHCHEHVHDGSHLHVHERGHLHAHESADPPVHEETHRSVQKGMQPPDSAGDAGDRTARAACVVRDGVGGTGAARSSMTPWVLFTIFVFGPCEVLIPLVMYPAATGRMWGVVLVTLVFGVTTITTMTLVVVGARQAMNPVRFVRLERYGHALAGFVVMLCGVAMQAGL